MKAMRKGLASLLALMMLVSALPVTALAEESQVPEAETSDEVVYNLQCSEVTVGTEQELAGSGYALFEEDGSYTIPLEDNAFFPYEVQFTYAGETWEEWFMDAEDTVTVGGHEFSVETEVTDPAALQEVGIWVGDQYVPAYPEEKTFTQASVMSLMPLKEKNLYIDLLEVLYPELKHVKASVVLNAVNAETGGSVPADQVFVWAKKEYSSDHDDDYTVIDPKNGTVMDLTPSDYWRDSVALSLIVGTGAADQLNPDNLRYNVSIDVNSGDTALFSAKAAIDGEPRQAIDVVNVESYYDDYNYDYGFIRYRVIVNQNDYDYQARKAISLVIAPEFQAAANGLDIQFYRGHYQTVEEISAAKAENVTALIWNTDPVSAGLVSQFQYGSEDARLTVVFKRGEEVVSVERLSVVMDEAEIDLYENLRTAVGNDYVSNRRNEIEFEDGRRIETLYLSKEYPADDEYRLHMHAYDNATEKSGQELIQYAAIGDWPTEEELRKHENVADVLFDSQKDGYLFSGEISITVLDQYGALQRITYKLRQYSHDDNLPPAPQPDEVDTYFRVNGVNTMDSYIMNAWDDGYYFNGYQTVFLLNQEGTAVPDGTIVPCFYTGNKVTMYAGTDFVSGTEQISGQTELTFRNGLCVPYSAAAEDSSHLKNYWVTFLTQKAGGPSLFVNAANDPTHMDEESKLPVREVYLTPDFDNHHDVFFANIGDTAMEEISVTLENPQNVALDEYWSVHEDSTRRLAAFTTVDAVDADGNYTEHGSLPNTAKIRLVPAVDENGQALAGDISGVLVISAKGIEPVRIKLTGTAGVPKITTEKIRDGVKYVPFNSVIQTNSMAASDSIKFSVVDGRLPRGVELFPNGKIYGMPTVDGEFTFTVQAVYKDDPDTAMTKEFTITIADNTDENVENATDPGYQVVDRVTGDIDIGSADYPEFKDEVFRSEGEYAQFCKFFLDGEELVDGEDYVSESGSTKITIRAQTMQNLNNGRHTIAAEFRTNKADTNTVKRAAQNFTISGIPSSGGHGHHDKPEPVKPNMPVEPKPVAGFQDVHENDWFAQDVQWAKDEKLMLGVTAQMFKPRNLISPATVVMVLSRMDHADLSRYEGVKSPGIPAGQWYSAAALWAREIGLLPDGEFTAQPPIARARLAVMLYQYLQHMGIDCTLPEALIPFTDAGQMTEEENTAFQVLYQFGIFKGVGGYYMDAEGSTTRAQLAVLMHRLSVFAEEHKN